MGIRLELFVYSGRDNLHKCASAHLFLAEKELGIHMGSVKDGCVPERVSRRLDLHLIVLLKTEAIRWRVQWNSPFLGFNLKFNLPFWRFALRELF